ncbi:MAG TPA: glycosyltransferase family 4 protein [Chloroflexota bacterium]|nr:glycosyltransferase family 4 protein [Chloroflexota bacterium]
MVLTTDAVGGVWDYALTLARGLMEDKGAQVLLAVVGPPPDAARMAEVAGTPGLEHRLLRGRLEWMEGGQGWLSALRQAVAELAAEWRADVIHVNQLGLAAVSQEPRLEHMSPPPAVVLGVHSDVTTWWLWVKDGGQGPCSLPAYLSWQRDLARQALRQADVVICPSAFLAGELAACHQLERVPLVVHNAVVPLPPAGRPPGSTVHEPGRAVVVGRVWDEAKNLSVVSAALTMCRHPWQVEVAGDVVEPGRPAAPLPAAPGLHYRGFLDKPRLVELYRRASVCIAPSSYEPFGLAPAEAALAGCAIVANDLPSYREVWGPAACYFRRNSAESLAETLDRLFADEPAVRRLARAARARVTRCYTVDRLVAGHLKAYQLAAALAQLRAPADSR